MIRKEIMDAIRERLAERAPKVAHVSLWNHNVEYIEQESGWERPAVFVEFGPIAWQALAAANLYRSQGAVLKLHVVTDYNDDADDATAWRLSDDVVGALAGMRGDGWIVGELQETLTNHNHEDLMESIETLGVRMTRQAPSACPSS